MILTNQIFLKLAEKFSANSINIWSRTLKAIGMSEVSQDTLKGHIKELIEAIKAKNYKSNKPYINALRNCYLCVDYDEDELKYLLSEWELACDTSDKSRKQDKDKQREEHTGFDIRWDDIQEEHEKIEARTGKNVYIHSDAIDWLVSALYSDEDFGIKRCIDIINLKRENIVDNKIVFKSQKNKFVYESKTLSNRILEPLKFVLDNTTSEYIITNNKRQKISSESMTYKLNKLFGCSCQYLRRLWASYHYAIQPTAQQLIRQAYELNHSIDTHLNDYVLAYDKRDYKVLGVYRFKKVHSYVRC